MSATRLFYMIMQYRNALSMVCAAGLVVAGLAASGTRPNDAAKAPPPCIFDPATQKMRECHHVTADGGCAHFGADCPVQSKGKTPCIFDKESQTYRECHHVTADGGCAHFGTACTP